MNYSLGGGGVIISFVLICIIGEPARTGFVNLEFPQNQFCLWAIVGAGSPRPFPSG